jgi:hypothetical protein
MTEHRRGPLHSYRTGALIGSAVVAATAGLVLLLGGGGQPTRSGPAVSEVAAASAPVTAAPTTPPPPASSVTTPPAPPSAPPTTPTAPPPSSSPLPTPTPGAVDEAQWRQVATGFATAFTAAPAPGQDWVAGLRPWISADLAATYASTDPTRLPTGTLPQVQPSSETPALVVATVRYQGGLQLAIDLTPTATEHGWVVSTVLLVPTS